MLIDRRSILAMTAAAVAGLAASRAAAMPAFVKYDAKTFDGLLKAGGSVVVHVHASWCPTCKQQTPTLESMVMDPDFAKVAFVRVDFDTDADFLKANRVASQSTIIVFKGGKETARSTGVTNAAQLRSSIKAAV